MSINTLKKLGQVIDEKLEKLDRTWETPHMLLSNTEAPDEEAQGQIENFLVSINKVHDELNELVEEQKESTADVDRFIKECEAIINDSIKPDCDALEDYLQKHGYTPLQKTSLNETLASESSILKDEELELRTQNLSLLDDNIDFDNLKNYTAPVENFNDYEDDGNQELGDKENAEKLKPTCIPTPVIKRLTRVKDQDINLTPSLLPKEPIYSPYFNPRA